MVQGRIKNEIVRALYTILVMKKERDIYAWYVISRSKIYPTCRQEPPINSLKMELCGIDSGLKAKT